MSKDNSEKKNWFIKHKILTILGIVILIIIIASVASGGKSNTETVTPNSNSNKSSSEPAKAEEKKIPLMDFYNQVQNGMTQAQVEALAVGIKPTSCSESQVQGLGTMKSCMYGGFFDKGTVSISYLNDSVNSKSKFNVD